MHIFICELCKQEGPHEHKFISKSKFYCSYACIVGADRLRRNQRQFLARKRPETKIKNQEQWRQSLLKKKGITEEQYNEILKNQNGVCKICKKECVSGRNLAIDHNHRTNQIRALLCTKCNTAIGLIDEDINLLESIRDYLIEYSNLELEFQHD